MSLYVRLASCKIPEINSLTLPQKINPLIRNNYMANKLHGRATTTPAIRKIIQESKDTIAVLAERYHINPKTVIKWKHRKSVQDKKSGPPSASKSLTKEQEAIAVAFRKHTKLPLDDCLYALRKAIPHLSRSSLHRCYQRNGISRLEEPKKVIKTKNFKAYPPGYGHVDITKVRTEEGFLYLFVGIDSTTKFCSGSSLQKPNCSNSCQIFNRNANLISQSYW